MSFGWSAGDIVAAIQLLFKIGNALKTVGGASSDYQQAVGFLGTLQTTLEHLRAFTYVLLDEQKAETLRNQCEQLRLPLNSFIQDVSVKFEPSLGLRKRKNVFSRTSREIEWALGTSRKLKDLQERILLPLTTVNMLLGLQTMDTLAHMPQRIQTEISASLETSLRSNLQPLEAIVNLHHSKTIKSQEKSTELVIQTVNDRNKETVELIRSQNLESRQATTSLQVKLEQMGLVISSIQNSLPHLPFLQQESDSEHVDTEMQRAMSTMLQGIFLLVSALQQLTRAFLLLLAPYLVAMYKSSIQPLLLFGDHFLFEDALGRIARLSCSQFQQWEIFYTYLTNTFSGSPGLKLVIQQNFYVMNGFNNAIIDQQNWGAAIQPKVRITMSMLLQQPLESRKCPLATCGGTISLVKTKRFGTCNVCKRHITILLPLEKETKLSTSNIKRLELGPVKQVQLVIRGATPTNPATMTISGVTPFNITILTQDRELLEHYLTLKLYKKSSLLTSSYFRARDKLRELRDIQLAELRLDVGEELYRRRESGVIDPPFLHPIDKFHPQRNWARKKLSTLPPLNLARLAADAASELQERDHPLKSSTENASKENIEAFKRVAWLSSEAQVKLAVVSKSDIQLLRNIIYSWAPHRSYQARNKTEAEEILFAVQDRGTYAKFMNILHSYNQNHISVLRCSEELSSLFTSYSFLDIIFKDIFREGLLSPL